MRKVLVFVMALSLSVMLLGCSGTDTSKEAKDTTQDTSQDIQMVLTGINI